MHLLLLLSLFFITLVLGSPSDVLYIEKLNADEVQTIDAHDLSTFADIFTTNAAYNPGPSQPTVYGIANIKAAIAFVIPPEVITQVAITTTSITLKPPFDEQGAAGTATGIIYNTVAYIGQGNVTGEALIFFAKFEDKYVKTGDFAHYGGWRISNRSFIPIVSGPKAEILRGGRLVHSGHYCASLMTTDPLPFNFQGKPVGNPNVLPPYLRALL